MRDSGARAHGGTPDRVRAGALLALLALGLVAAPARGQEETDTDVPYVPTPMAVVRQMLELAEVGPSDTVYDLGSGDGRIVITAAKEFGARGVGVEIDPELVEEARANAREEGVSDRVRFIEGDLFETDFSPATAVTMYLLHSVNLRLRHRLLDELRPGTPLVSHDFGMGDWHADSTVRMDSVSANVLRWTIPAEVAGTWRIRLPGERTLRLEIRQKFQAVRATLHRGRRDSAALRDISLSGNRIRMVLPAGMGSASGSLRLQGRVEEGRMSGRLEGGGEWSARRLRAGSGWPKQPPWPYRNDSLDVGVEEPVLPPPSPLPPEPPGGGGGTRG
jgi:SAM-dependent methyltransferase